MRLSGRSGAPALVLGSGPAACIAAVSLARRGWSVTLATGPSPSDRPSRIDAVPIQLLAALIEVGIHPGAIGVTDREDTMLRAWDCALPRATRTSPKVHLDRTRLEQALLDLAARTPDLRLEAEARPADFETVLDATGRRSSTAATIHHASPEWVARIKSFDGQFTKAQTAFRIAALPFGYVYRLGTPARLSLGLVAPADEEATLGTDWRDALNDWGVGWFTADIPLHVRASSGRGGTCSMQWSDSGGALLIGDAAFAPDILAAQGLSRSVTDGLAAAAHVHGDHADRMRSHVTAMRSTIALCRWRDSRAWRRYDSELASRNVS